VSVRDGSLQILRPGPIDGDQLACIGPLAESGNRERTPGSLPGHYAPGKPLRILEGDFGRCKIPANAGYLAFTPPPDSVRNRFSVVEVLSSSGDLREAAVRLYAALRLLDESSAETLYADRLPEKGIGVAIMDRLRRASHGSLGMPPSGAR
jgi:L-threonylcarbamoyladenylate synthase